MRPNSDNISSLNHTGKVKNDCRKGGSCLFMILLILGIVALFACTAIVDADETDAGKFTVDGIKYKTTPSMEVKVIGCKNIKELVIPSTVLHSGKEYRVTSISYDAFDNNKSLTSAVIPEGVKSIGRSAFYECEKLISVTIPDSVTSIGGYAFEHCYSLLSVIIPSGVKSIGENTFAGCTSLRSVVLPDSLTSIGNYAFGECTSLTSVTIPDGTRSIGSMAFWDCTSLTYVAIPSSVKSIKDDAFHNFNFYNLDGKAKIKSYHSLPGYIYIGESPSKLIRHLQHNVLFNENGGSVMISGIDVSEGKGFTLPEYTWSKAGMAFAGWSYGGDVHCEGETVTKVSGDMVFTAVWVTAFTVDGMRYKVTSDTTVEVVSCGNSDAVVIPASISYHGRDFSITSISAHAFENCTSLKSVTISDSVRSLDKRLFKGCTSLTNLTIGNGVKSLDKRLFKDCTSLETVIIGDSVKSIGEFTFKNCKFLKSVTIGKGVKSIGKCAFSGCSKLENIHLLRTDGVTSICKSSFDGCDSLYQIYVPDNRYNDYVKAKCWSQMIDCIVPLKEVQMMTADVPGGSLQTCIGAVTVAQTSVRSVSWI